MRDEKGSTSISNKIRSSSRTACARHLCIEESVRYLTIAKSNFYTCSVGNVHDDRNWSLFQPAAYFPTVQRIPCRRMSLTK